MRENWTYKKLGEVCEIEYGTRVVQARDGGSIYPVYGGGGATFMMDTYNRENRVVVSRFAMSKKCTRKVIGKFFLNDSGLTIKSKEPLLLQNYLDTFILSSNDKIYHLGRGLAQKNLKVPDLLQIDIAIPNAEVQQSIVAELDKINELISLKKAQLSDLDALAQSIFYDMFGDPIGNEKGWEVKKLGVLSEIGTGATPSRTKEDLYYGGAIPWVKTTEVCYQDIYDTEEKITPLAIKETNCKIYPVGTLLMAMYGQGKTRGQVAKLMVEAATNQACAAIQVDNKIIHIDYLYALMIIQYDSIRAMAQGGNQANLNMKLVGNIPVPLPPLSLQQDFAKRVELIEQQKAQISSTIKDLETLLASRMQYWFD